MQTNPDAVTLQIPEQTVKQIVLVAQAKRLTPELLILAAIRKGVPMLRARCSLMVDKVQR